MNKARTLKSDAIFWVLIMCVAMVIAFTLLQRDKNRQFGAVTLGGFPEFQLKTASGGVFDKHQIKAGVWAVHAVSSESAGLAIAKRLAIVEAQTRSGKRHINIISFVHGPTGAFSPLLPYHHVLIGTPQEIGTIFVFTPQLRDQDVFLVDQDGIVRGRYDFDNVDEYRKFQQDLLRIL